MSTVNPTIQKFLAKYDYLAKQYAGKVFNYERAGYQKSDIEQEFRIKIYTTILAYGERWSEYRRTNRYKPVPIEYYIKNALGNKLKDLIKQFNLMRVENEDKLNFDGVDVGTHNTMVSDVDLKKLKMVINEVDCLEGLNTDQKRCFILYLKGYTIGQLQKIFLGKCNAETTITRQLSSLRAKKDQLMDYTSFRFETYTVSED